MSNSIALPALPVGERVAGWLGRFLHSPWALCLAIALAFCLNVGSLPLTDVDEGAFSEATREMMARGNLVSPTLNGQPRHDKPILIYWAQAASVAVFGVDELAFRLPSLLAAVLWLWALHRFCRRHVDRETAQVAALVLALSLLVGIVARAAIADALLNLWLALAMFAIYDYDVTVRRGDDGRAIGRVLLAAYAALGLGFLTKGPVAVLFPALVGAFYLGWCGQWRSLRRAALFWPGWLLFVAIVLPWHVLVYLDQGDAFFRGFYLQHNVNRYASTFEGHGGNPFYYLLALPLIVLPFTGWLFVAARGIGRAALRDEIDSRLTRFLLCWFGVVFVFFSLSRTQLPHYLLYGATPLFILCALQRQALTRRVWLFAPALALLALIALSPQLAELMLPLVTRPLENAVLTAYTAAFAGWPQAAAGVALLLAFGLAVWRSLPTYQALLLVGLLQAAIVGGLVAPAVLGATQQGVREAAALAQAEGLAVVAWRVNLPSFSVYRQAETPQRLPKIGETVLTRPDRLPELAAAVAPARLDPIFSRGLVVLARVLPEDER